MKSRIRRVLVVGLSLLVFPLVGGCLPQTSTPAETSAAAAQPEKSPDQVVPPVVEQPVAETQPVDDESSSEISDAPATPVSDDITVPANLRPTPAVSEIIKIANSGVGENVMLTIVTNSTSTFNLRPEEIIYLTDIGVPAGVITAMLQHDHMMQARQPYVSELSSVPPGAAVLTNQPVIADQYVPQPPLALAPDQVAAATAEIPPQYAPISYQLPEEVVPAEPEPAPDFYDSLSPYGTWVDVSGYGWCWQPTAVVVNPAWEPYCDHGHWVYSSCGWYWMSDYSWGWAPFHYGRWFQHQRLGWCWVPDHVWGPSWVCWRYSQNYCGWAALPPSAGFVAGTGLTFHGHKANSNSSFGLAAHQFHFVSTDHFTDRHVNRHVVSRDQATKVFANTVASTTTTLRNDTVVISGIPKDRIAAITRQQVPQVALHANPARLPLSGSQPFSDKVQRRPASAPNTFAAQALQENALKAPDVSVASPSHSAGLPPKPFAVASFGSPNATLPRSHRDAQPVANENANAVATTIVSQPQPGKPGPLIMRGPARPQQEHLTIVNRPLREPGNSTLVVIGSRHPAPAAGFTHTTSQPVHLPSAQQPNQSLAIPSDNIGNSRESEQPARFHQSMALPTPPANANPSAPAQPLPWWMSQPANRGEINQSQPSAPAYVSHPAPAPAHHENPAASQHSSPAPTHSQSPSHSAPSAPAASHSQSSSGKGSR